MILVTGATGFIGRSLMRRLPEASKVRCLVRRDVRLGEGMDVSGPLGEPDEAIASDDFEVFQLCASGPDVPADPACDD